MRRPSSAAQHHCWVLVLFEPVVRLIAPPALRVCGRCARDYNTWHVPTIDVCERQREGEKVYIWSDNPFVSAQSLRVLLQNYIYTPTQTHIHTLSLTPIGVDSRSIFESTARYSSCDTNEALGETA